MSRGTTKIGFINRNLQRVIRKTDLGGTDHNQKVYELECLECGHRYGANGSDIFQRRCPEHDSGKPGFEI